MNAVPVLAPSMMSPAERPPRPPVATSALTWVVIALGSVGSLVTWPTLLVMLYFFAPKFREIYRDFGVNLSPTARMFCDLSAWVQGAHPWQSIPGWITLLCCGAFVSAVAVVLVANTKTRPLAALLLLTLALVGTILFLTFIVSMYTPLVTMTQQLQGAPTQGP